MLDQACEHINDTFVVKCVEQIKAETYLGLEVSDLISAIIAFFSVLAAGLAAYAAWKANRLSESEAKANRLHNQLSVRPLVHYNTSISTLNFAYSISVKNSGLGPGIIKGHSVYFEQVKIESGDDIIKAIKSFIIDSDDDDENFGLFIEAVVRGNGSYDVCPTTIPVGENFVLLEVRIKASGGQEISRQNNTSMEEYCSAMIDYIYAHITSELLYEDLYGAPYTINYKPSKIL